MAKSTRSRQGRESIGGRSGLVCAIDLTGFTRWVDDEVDRHGARGLEAIADDLSAFLRGASSILSEEGFLLGSLLGDGLLAVRSGPTADRGEVEARIREALERLEPNARIGFGEGSFERRVFAGLPGTSHTVLTGPAVRGCYQALEASPRRVGSRSLPAPVQPSMARIETAEVADQVIGFLAFRAHNLTTLGRFVDEHLAVWQASALANWGQLDRLTYDDDALLVRFTWPTAVIDAAGAAEFLAAQASARLATMHAGWGAAQGPVFRARLAGVASLTGEDLDVVEGPAINQAAKQAKRMLASGSSDRFETSRFFAAKDTASKIHVGRASELAWIKARIDAGRRLVLVTGEAGIGKSSLLEMASAALGDSFAVVVISAKPGDVLEPLGLWRSAVPTDRHAPIDAQRAAIGEQLAVRSLQRPLLVVVDDLQWADPYSRKLIDELVRTAAPITILAAGRPGASTQIDLPSPDDLLALDGMPAADIETLVRSHCDQPSALIHKLAGGNPFLTVQLALEWRASDQDREPPKSLASIVDLRLARLAPPELAALRLFAVVDRELDLADFAQVCGAAGIALDAAATQTLRERKFIEPGKRPNSLAIAHRLIQQRIQEQIPPSALLRLSAVVGRLLRGRLGPAPALGVVGAHLRGAQQLSRAVIADFADAERALAIHANAPAAELFARATADLERLRAKADRIALSRAGDGLAAWGAGNVPAAFAAAEGTTAALASAMSWPVRARIVGAIVTGKRHWLSPRFALALVRQAALRSELGYFAGNLVDIMVGGLVVSRLSDDREALQLARTRSLGLLALGVGLIGFKRGALAIFSRCQRANDQRLPAAYAFCAEALYHFANGAWNEGDRCIAASEARLGSPRDFHLYGALLCVRALSLHMRGETGEAIAAFDALHQLGKQRDNRQFEAWALYGSAMPLIAAGRFAEAEAKVEAASAMMEGNADTLSTLNCRALGSQLAWIRGDGAAAIEQAELCLDLARTIFPANFGSLDGFTLPALVLADIIVSAQSAPELSARARNLMPAALAQARRFASRCPIGGPRLAATHAELTRSNALRRRHQDRMERLALELGMPAQLLHAIPINPKPAVSAIQS